MLSAPPRARLIITAENKIPSLARAVLSHAATDPDGLAICDDEAGTELTWHALVDTSASLAIALHDGGVTSGSYVAAHGQNGLPLVTLWVATRALGAVCVPLAHPLGTKETRAALDHLGSDVLVVGARDELPTTRPERRRSLSLEDVIGVEMTSPRESALIDRQVLQFREPDVDNVALVTFTSGTSGRQKGVPHSERALTTAAQALLSRIPMQAGDAIANFAPMAHHGGFLYAMWLALISGSTQVVGPWNVNTVWATLERHRVAAVPGPPAFVHDLLLHEPAKRPTTPPLCVVIGAGLPAPLRERAQKSPNLDAVVAWGTSETCMATLSEATATAQGEALGTVLDLRVVDDDGTTVPAGTSGLLEVRTSTMFSGYLGLPAATRAALTDDGYFRTLDLATVDPRGGLTVHGRAGDAINRGGVKVPVHEVEEELRFHASIHDVAIIGVPDARLGERAVACVELAPTSEAVTLQSLLDFLEPRRVARRHWPEGVYILPSLPRNFAGKVLRTELARILAPLSDPATRPPETDNTRPETQATARGS